MRGRRHRPPLGHRLRDEPDARPRPKRHEVLGQLPELEEYLDLIDARGLTVEAWEALPESEREWWLARFRRERGRHACGHLLDECSDPTLTWYPQLEVCYPEREKAAAWARFRELHSKRPWHDGTFESWAEKQSASHPYHFEHGTTIRVTSEDLGHGGDFTRWHVDLDDADDLPDD